MLFNLIKRLKKYSLIFLVFLSLVSCQKLELNRINKVKTKNVFWTNNTLKIESELIDVAVNSTINYGICYAIEQLPDINNGVTLVIGNTNQPLSYNAQIPQVLPGLNYYIRAYAKSNDEVIYGDLRIVNTQLSNIQLNVSIPNISSSKKVDIIGTIANVGDLRIKEIGHCYGYKPNPTVNENKIISSTNPVNGGVDFTSSITSPLKDTNYYFRTYLILEDNQVFYSSSSYFKIKSHKLYTLTLSKENADQDLKMTGIFNQLGIDSITEYGFCWSTNTNKPTINDSRLIVQNTPIESNVFSKVYRKNTNSSFLNYYVRAYAIFDNMVVYGDVLNIEY